MCGRYSARANDADDARNYAQMRNAKQENILKCLKVFLTKFGRGYVI